MRERAEESLESAQALSDLIGGGRRDSWVGYAAQQALEHGYKSLISSAGKEYPKSGKGGHDLEALAEIIRDELRESAVPGERPAYLSAFAGAGRCEGEKPELHDRDALLQEVFEVVSDLMDLVEQRTGTRPGSP